MIPVAISSVVAAVLLLASRQTRALGVAAVFILLSLRPLLLGPLLVVAAIIHLLVRRLFTRGPSPRP